MGAGLGFKTFVTGDVLTAADTNGYLMQGVWVFASAAARDAAVTSPQEGNMCYLKDTDAVQSYSGSAWTAVGGTANTNLAQVATGSMTGTSVTISSLSSYDTLMLSLTGVTWGTAADNIRVRINSLTSSSYLKNGFAINTSRLAISTTATSFALQDSANQANADANNNYFYVFTKCKAAAFTGVQAVGRYIDSTTASTAVSVNGVIISNEAVSSLVIATSNAYTFSAGTYTVWGA